MRGLIFAANWKMNLGPSDAAAYMASFLPACDPNHDRMVWFFPPALSVTSVVAALRESGRHDIVVGVQDIYWEDQGAFTGAVSARMAAQAGAALTLVGHSERRHVFGETDEQTGRKIAAALRANLFPVLCVGETLAQRDAGETLAVITRQLEAALAQVTANLAIAYEPVWAIGTGRNATPKDAADVHRAIRQWLRARTPQPISILYGGSVNLKNVAALLAEPELDGVLVGGASLDPKAWAELVRTARA